MARKLTEEQMRALRPLLDNEELNSLQVLQFTNGNRDGSGALIPESARTRVGASLVLPLVKAKLIEQTRQQGSTETWDRNLKYYRITKAGRDALKAGEYEVRKDGRGAIPAGDEGSSKERKGEADRGSGEQQAPDSGE